MVTTYESPWSVIARTKEEPRKESVGQIYPEKEEKPAIYNIVGTTPTGGVRIQKEGSKEIETYGPEYIKEHFKPVQTQQAKATGGTQLQAGKTMFYPSLTEAWKYYNEVAKYPEGSIVPFLKGHAVTMKETPFYKAEIPSEVVPARFAYYTFKNIAGDVGITSQTTVLPWSPKGKEGLPEPMFFKEFPHNVEAIIENIPRAIALGVFEGVARIPFTPFSIGAFIKKEYEKYATKDIVSEKLKMIGLPENIVQEIYSRTPVAEAIEAGAFMGSAMASDIALSRWLAMNTERFERPIIIKRGTVEEPWFELKGQFTDKGVLKFLGTNKMDEQISGSLGKLSDKYTGASISLGKDTMTMSFSLSERVGERMISFSVGDVYKISGFKEIPSAKWFSGYGAGEQIKYFTRYPVVSPKGQTIMLGEPTINEFAGLDNWVTQTQKLQVESFVVTPKDFLFIKEIGKMDVVMKLPTSGSAGGGTAMVVPYSAGGVVADLESASFLKGLDRLGAWSGLNAFLQGKTGIEVGEEMYISEGVSKEFQKLLNEMGQVGIVVGVQTQFGTQLQLQSKLQQQLQNQMQSQVGVQEQLQFQNQLEQQLQQQTQQQQQLQLQLQLQQMQQLGIREMPIIPFIPFMEPPIGWEKQGQAPIYSFEDLERPRKTARKKTFYPPSMTAIEFDITKITRDFEREINKMSSGIEFRPILARRRRK